MGKLSQLKWYYRTTESIIWHSYCYFNWKQHKLFILDFLLYYALYRQYISNENILARNTLVKKS